MSLDEQELKVLDGSQSQPSYVIQSADRRCLQEDGVNFCYSDESGIGQEPIATLVGIIVDSGRMHLTKRDWAELIDALGKRTSRPISEIHTADFYNGNGVWRNLSGGLRSAVTSLILDWLVQRKHRIVYTAVLKAPFFEAVQNKQIPDEINTPYRFMAFHLALAVQRYSQPELGTKGNTVLVFDNEEMERVKFSDVVLNPPRWSDAYYTRGKKQAALDQIIDVPYFGDSKELPLLQVADFLAFFLRRYAEIEEGWVSPKYEDERDRIKGWIAQMKAQSIGTAHIYPRRQRNNAHEIFYRHAPKSIRDL